MEMGLTHSIGNLNNRISAIYVNPLELVFLLNEPRISGRTIISSQARFTQHIQLPSY